MRLSSDLLGLRETVEYIKTHEKELRRWNVHPIDTIHEGLGALLDTQNVRVTVGRTTSEKPEEIAVLNRATEVLAVIDSARRVGRGSIHTGSQQCSVMADQQPI